MYVYVEAQDSQRVLHACDEWEAREGVAKEGKKRKELEKAWEWRSGRNKTTTILYLIKKKIK